ncbi:MAG: DNA primase [Alphaproteobacteria bacterium]|nr:DNA primase [Alphaproteobacteria bacterium]MBQ6011980.1 DNA primase [Alphaproteobacteria bacterium]
MSKFSNSFTDELRQRLSLVDVISRRVPLKKKGQNYWGCCPFHNEKTPSFSVNEEKGFYHCFGCGEHGDIISFTMKSENIDFKTAISELADMAGIKMPEIKQKTQQQIEEEENYIKITEHAAKIYQDLLYKDSGKQALEYIKTRGFSDEMIKKYRIGYAPKSNIISSTFNNIKIDKLTATGLVRVGEFGPYDFFRDKLMFPIFNAHNQIIAFSGRSLDGSEPKYINTTDTELFHKRQTLFGFNFARDAIHRKNRSIVVEGQIDAIQMQNHGFAETVAPLGTALTEDHIAILCKSNRNIVFCFDGDTAGQKAAVRACTLVLPFLRETSDVKFAFVTGGKDPDEILKNSGKEAMQKIIDNALPLVDFLWEIVNKNYLVNTPGGRTSAEKYLKDCISKINDKIFQNEINEEYNNRKFNQWHKWKKQEYQQDIEIPDVDIMTQNIIKSIVQKYPEISEKYIDFLLSLNLSFDEDVKHTELNIKEAENYIKSFKLQIEIKKLEKKKKELLSNALNGENYDKELLEKINTELKDYNNKLELLLDSK